MTPEETRSAVDHLLRRAGFATATPEVERLAERGYESVVELVCDHTGTDAGADAVPAPTFDPVAAAEARGGDDPDRARRAMAVAAQERRQLVAWWVARMVAAERPHREKLTFLWHDHFATSMRKVRVAALMYGQRATLHELGGGRFDVLADAVAVDPAMLWWLDGHTSTAASPNENFARELFELFTLGHVGADGRPPYTEADVAEAARALTGWDIDRRTGLATFDPARHDGGVKTVLGVTGRLDLHDVVAAATRHPACAPHVVARLWSRLARPAGPDDPVVAELAAPFAEDLDVTALLRRLFLHPEFLAPATRRGLLKTPVELVVGIARQLDVRLDETASGALQALEQIPFLPPDVAGWPSNEAWLSTAASLVHRQLAADVAGRALPAALADATPAERPELAAHLLGIDGWGSTTAASLRRTAGDPRAVLATALAAPEHLLA